MNGHLVVPGAGARLRAFLVCRQLSGRQRFQTLVGNRPATLDREAVGAGGQTLLGSVDGGEPALQVLGQALVELLLVETGCAIRRVLPVGLLTVVFMPTAGRASSPGNLSIAALK